MILPRSVRIGVSERPGPVPHCLSRRFTSSAANKRLDKMMDEALIEDRDRALLQQWRSSRVT